MDEIMTKWRPFAMILLLFMCLSFSTGKPQLDGAPPNGPLVSDAGAVSPWSQWMSLKAPPIPGLLMGGGGGGAKAKKKLIPGPAPPEGTPEAPWLAWTRMKVSPPVMPAPISSFINPVPPTSTPQPSPPEESGDEGPSVWIQWAQLKLPLTDLLLSSLNMSTPGGSSFQRRMAPDRYESTVAPRLWSPPQLPPRPSYTNFIPQQAVNQVPMLPRLIPSSNDILAYSPIAPSRQETLAQALRPLPHQIISEMTSKATPEELVQTILAVSKAESVQIPVQVGQLVPTSFQAKLSDDLTPLLKSVVKPAPPPTGSKLPPTPPASLRMIPTSARKALVPVATPAELTQVLATLSKLEALSPSDQSIIGTLPVSVILPAPLATRVQPTLTSSKLIPPKLLTLPAQLVEGLVSEATPAELTAVIENISKLEKLPSLAPRPPVKALLPQSLLAKIPPQMAPVLSQPFPPEPESPPLTPPTVVKALPEPLATIIPQIATPAELTTIDKAVSLLAEAATLPGVVPPPVTSVIPSSLIIRLPPQIKPVLSEPLILPPAVEETGVAPVLQDIPFPVLRRLLPIATPEELQQLQDTILKEVAAAPVKSSVVSLLPVSLAAKLPPAIIPVLASNLITIEAPPKSILVAKALSKLPPPVSDAILKIASPPEIDEIKAIVSELSQLSPEQKAVLPEIPIGRILPATLLGKLPPPLAPMLTAPVVVPSLTPTIPVSVGPPMPQPPAPFKPVTTALAALPAPLASEIVSVATPNELTQLATILEKLEALPETQISQLDVFKVLPPSIVAKLPPTTIPILTATPAKVLLPPVETSPPPIEAIKASLINIPPELASFILATATPTDLTVMAAKLEALEAPATRTPPIPSVLDVVPPELVAKLPPSVLPALKVPVVLPPPPPASPLPSILPALEALPPPVAASLLAAATPEEIQELAATITKLQTLPPDEAALIDQLELKTILPPSLVDKLPPTILSALEVPLTLEKVEPPISAESSIAPILANVPPLALSEILGAATLQELDTIKESIFEIEKFLGMDISKVPVASVLPPTLVAKLPPAVLPLLQVPVAVPELVPSSPVASSILPVMANVPPKVVASVLAEATPPELKAIEEIVTKVSQVAPADIPLLASVEVSSILPETLISKLSPPVLDALNVPITVPGVPLPTQVKPLITSALEEVPPPLLDMILSLGTPSELSQLATTIAKIQLLPPPEIAMLNQVEVATILPESLLAKLPPAALPLLDVPIVITPEVKSVADLPLLVAPPSPPAPVPEMPPIPPILANVPTPVAGMILSMATPVELKMLEETATKLDQLPPSEAALIEELEVDTIMPASLLARLPPSVLPLLDVPVVPVTDSTPAPADIAFLAEKLMAKVPPQIASEILSVASPKELEETVTKLETDFAAYKPIVIQDILPPSLLAKLAPPPSIPTAVLPPVLSPPEVASEIPGLPPSVSSVVVPPLMALPPPAIKTILSTATPTELAEMVDEITKLEAAPVPDKPVVSVLPVSLIQKLPPPVLQTLMSPLVLPSTATNPPIAPFAPNPVVPAAPAEVLPPAEKAVLTKWAKVILDKTGKPGVVTSPDELPPLQAAWLEWVQLKTNKSTDQITTASPLLPPPSTTEFPWTKWLKLKSNSTSPPLPPHTPPPFLDVSTTSPEKDLLAWLEQLEASTVAPQPFPVPPFPKTAALVAEALKELGVEASDLPPEQLQTIIEQVEQGVPPEPVPPVSYPAFWPVAPEYSPLSAPNAPFASPPVAPTYPPSPTLNLTEYLITNSLLPPETPPTAPIPTSILAQLVTDKILPPGSQPVSASDLGSLTPTKLAALLKQVLSDCRVNVTYPNVTSVSTRSTHASYRDKRSPALYPIPSQAFTPTTSPPSLDLGSLPLPKVDTSDTVLDPAYWAAQKSMFLSKLFSTLANVALNDSTASSTPSPKDQLVKQVNTVLLTDLTRSVHHRPPKKHHKSQKYDYDEDSSEDSYDYQNDQRSDFTGSEKQLAGNDDSQPNLPQEPDNPLHKLFKFGVQKTVLSDPHTPEPYPEPESPSRLADRLKAAYDATLDKGNRHHSPGKKHRFRGQHTTTSSPVDFEALAKALLLEGEQAQAGNGSG